VTTQLLFENFSPGTRERIRRTILDALRNYEPRVAVQAVNVNPRIDINAYDCTIVFRIRNIPDPVSVQLQLERIR